ncbi:MAG TPA: type II pantothenate kinase [Firmicutes bacterium]|jgi:type II pantothenate kinase|nr:type II pantothenate kinase [Bacillota bacterium]
MNAVLGVDVGGSTTKIVLSDLSNRITDKLQVQASDQVTSLYGAIGNMLDKNFLSLRDIKRVVLTGVGADLVQDRLYDIPTFKVNEFRAIGWGGLMLSGLERALVVSMGTGTAFVRAQGGQATHIGGSGVGGGTLLGLSSKLFGEKDINVIAALAAQGDLQNVDLSISDISTTVIPSLPSTATASNFGKIKSTANESDMALGLLNMLYQTVGMLAVFACLDHDLKDVVVTGAVASLPQAKSLMGEVGDMYNLNFIVPDNATFATAIGATALYFQAN